MKLQKFSSYLYTVIHCLDNRRDNYNHILQFYWRSWRWYHICLSNTRVVKSVGSKTYSNKKHDSFLCFAFVSINTDAAFISCESFITKTHFSVSGRTCSACTVVASNNVSAFCAWMAVIFKSTLIYVDTVFYVISRKPIFAFTIESWRRNTFFIFRTVVVTALAFDTKVATAVITFTATTSEASRVISTNTVLITVVRCSQTFINIEALCGSVDFKSFVTFNTFETADSIKTFGPLRAAWFIGALINVRAKWTFTSSFSFIEMHFDRIETLTKMHSKNLFLCNLQCKNSYNFRSRSDKWNSVDKYSYPDIHQCHDIRWQ